MIRETLEKSALSFFDLIYLTDIEDERIRITASTVGATRNERLLPILADFIRGAAVGWADTR
ncbi:MAG: hypothetical protein K2K99_01980, partial [Muribaculaceae bacterium]|nr:hypothetical protein [Muribaculaceae bacterium]